MLKLDRFKSHLDQPTAHWSSISSVFYCHHFSCRGNFEQVAEKLRGGKAMRPKIEEVEEKSLLCGEGDLEEEKVWIDPRVSRETILCEEGLVIFQLFDRVKMLSDFDQILAGRNSAILFEWGDHKG